MRLRRSLLPALTLCGLAAASRPAAAQPVYIALGDSVAYGYTDTLNMSNGDQGYVAPFAGFLSNTFYGGAPIKVDNLAISGETAAEFAGPTPNNSAVAANTNYSTPLVGPNGPATPEAQAFFNAVAYEKAQGNTIADVSLSIGADDGFAAFASGQPITNSSIDALVNGVGIEENSFLQAFRAALPNTQLLLLNYYNPFPTYAVPMTPDQATSNYLSGLSARAGTDYTTVQQNLAATFGGKFVDISGLPTSDTYLLAQDPLAPFPTGVHPNAAGYQYIAGQLDQAAVPEANPWALLTLGLPVLGIAVAVRRRAATV